MTVKWADEVDIPLGDGQLCFKHKDLIELIHRFRRVDDDQFEIAIALRPHEWVKLLQKLLTMHATLTFYAAAANYRHQSEWGTAIEIDGGSRAREAIRDEN